MACEDTLGGRWVAGERMTAITSLPGNAGRRSSGVMVTGGEDKRVNMWALGRQHALLVSSGSLEWIRYVESKLKQRGNGYERRAWQGIRSQWSAFRLITRRRSWWQVGPVAR